MFVSLRTFGWLEAVARAAFGNAAAVIRCMPEPVHVFDDTWVDFPPSYEKAGAFKPARIPKAAKRSRFDSYPKRAQRGL